MTIKCFAILWVLPIFTIRLSAQQTDSTKNDRFTVHAQTTLVNQSKTTFRAKYSGANSLSTDKENQLSVTSTLFLGARLWKGASIYLNPEIAGGSGLSQTLGIGDATNGETFRVGSTAPKLYLARLFYKQVFSLSKESTYQASDFNQLGERLPTKYLAFTLGKVGVADYFDDNKFSHDARTQFMCWGLMDNGAWDYPANTRGYSPSAIIEWVSPKNELRYGMSLVPLSANGNNMNWDVLKANSHSIEYTHRHYIHNQAGAIRLLAFFTTANMGNYRQSIALSSQQPVIEDTRKYGHTKYGFAINAEQNISHDLGAFFRASWNDGNNETWMFTEIDHSLSLGLSMTGKRWSRENDNIGLAIVASGISKPHQAYLKAGGKDFMLGDGTLNYAWEQLGECYYSTELIKKYLYLTGTYQLLFNPGYNKDRHGPINIFSVRLHIAI